jgi:hypothetical protein
MPVSIGRKPYAISTVSAWTNEFMPAFPPPPYSLGQDNIATVATQVTVYNASNRLMGRFYTRDTIDLSGIIGGTGIFTNARGAYRIGSALGMDGAVNITSIVGSICNVGESL